MKVLLVVAVVLVQFVNFSYSIACDLEPKNTEGRLKKKLFCSYDPAVRPITNPNDVTTVNISLYIHTFDHSEFEGTLTLQSWVRMKWKDEHLKWNKAEFDNIDDLVINSDDIWKPDLSTYHSQSTQYHESCSSSQCLLTSDGSVFCIPPCSHSGQCQDNYDNWPYDSQKCDLHFGSWMHKGSEIRFLSEKVNLEDDALKHNEWKIKSVKSKNIRGNYSCCPNETYPSVKYTFVIERHNAAEKTFIVTPAIILIILNLVTLWLNPICAERIVVTVVSMFAHFIYLQQLSWYVPKNGSTAPKVLIFFRDSLIITTVLLVDTIVKKGLMNCKTATPAWLKVTTNSLKGNKIGQLMFTNPYLINKVPLDGDVTPTDDLDNLMEGQPAAGEQTTNTKPMPETEERNMWRITVRILDTLMFLVLFITYFILLFGWMPMSYISPNTKLNVEILHESE